ncbi:MAG TPA: aminotransferase class I/II-fold pyridoxal phosphate-dependent enzyme [Spirochaetota bacterium]|nr:aminotransferase class I/II-fold pyridoxal phosphate-dependent enzyme [Spirochaetota bacterium]HPC40777.1 aminotransferase class I/II-fold pyridoxal phosphate-dependent enzyme [Spirochaetota bacterium]HPL18736.1 aminotransferase class I/II-fold pyridoxal phosphate-dependent enzyme [Spirochaetota bacterium]HQF10365.1 aminotransferase class I/II-fold pyridoxal phosphate-dependent enzyme [Spirochaetota bacterium]HQH99238.1 aminotransferase class I/II-fold pyridoxal phosphate-dependent enzyme [S
MIDSDARDGISLKLNALSGYAEYYLNNNLYFCDQPVTELRGGSRVIVNVREMGMFSSYSYLGLIGHPRINRAAMDAIDRFGTGTHGVRLLAGTLPLHKELEETIAEFKGAEAALTFTSGYVTNAAVVAALTAWAIMFTLTPSTTRASSTAAGSPGRRPCGSTIMTWTNSNGSWPKLPPAQPGWSSPMPCSAWTATSSIFLPRLADICRRHGA